MPPALALFVWFVLLVALLWYDPAKESRTSAALWVPLVWMLLAGSRLPSQWLGMTAGSATEALQEGSSLDRAVFAVLIVLAIGILVSRSFTWNTFVARNLALVAFVCFSLVSISWSDFPLIAFKRWFRDFGNYLVVCVVLTERYQLESIQMLLRRLSYFLIPLSIVVIKYFPHIGRQYSVWTGEVTYSGVTTSKNMLGAVCLISGLFFCWDIVTRWPTRKEQRTKRILFVNLVFVSMLLWLLISANSVTSSVCLVIGCLVIVATQSKCGRRHASRIKVLVPAFFCLYLILALGFDINAHLAPAMGRSATLTDRTKIWEVLLSIHTNPLIGTGYESFWLGPRLASIWGRSGHVNEAHNGYLEIYLNLGFVGLFLISALLTATYRNVCRRLRRFSDLASLNLAVWTVMLFFSITEAGFRSGLMWLIFLVSGIVIPDRRKVFDTSVVCSHANVFQHRANVMQRSVGLR